MKTKPTKIQRYDTYTETLRNSERYIMVVAQRLNQDEHIDDLINEGRVGLFEAWNRYNPSTGIFHSFAISYIRGYMLKYLSNNARTIRIPLNAQRVSGFTENITISTDMSFGDDVNSSSIGDMLEADEVEYWNNEHFNIELDDAQDAHRRLLSDNLIKLDDRDRLIIKLRYTDEFTYQKIADEIGCTREYIRQRLQIIIKRLRKNFGVNKKRTI